MDQGGDNDPMGMSLLLNDVMEKRPNASSMPQRLNDIDQVINQIEIGSDGDLDGDNNDGDDIGIDEDDGEDDGDYGDGDEDDGDDDESMAKGARPRQHSYHAPPKIDPMIEINQKKEILYQFDRLMKNGHKLPRQFNLSSDLHEMRAELERIQRDKSIDAAVAFQRKGMLSLVSIIEWLNLKFFPNAVQLSGWSQQIQDTSEYDELFEELYVKYIKNGKRIPVEIRLIFTFVMGAFLCHMNNTMFKNMPELQQVMKQNPKIMRDMAGAVMNSAVESNSPGKEGANPLMGSLAGLMSNLFTGGSGMFGNAPSPPPPPPTQAPFNQSNYMPSTQPKMRGPVGFSQMMEDIGSLKPPQPSARIETFSTASDSDISELKDGSISGSYVSRRGNRRVLNL